MKEKITRQNIEKMFDKIKGKIGSVLRDGYATIMQGMTIEDKDTSGESKRIIDYYLELVNKELAKDEKPTGTDANKAKALALIKIKAAALRLKMAAGLSGIIKLREY